MFFFQENKINQRECRDSYGQAANAPFKRITEEVGFDGEFEPRAIGSLRCSREYREYSDLDMYNYSGINVNVYSLDRNWISRQTFLFTELESIHIPIPIVIVHPGPRGSSARAWRMSFSWIQKVFSNGKTVTNTSNHLMKVPGFLIHCKDLNLFDTGATILPGETCSCKMKRLRWSLCKTVGILYRWGKHVRCSPNEGFCWFTCCIGSRLDSADSANSWILAYFGYWITASSQETLAIFHPTVYTFLYYLSMCVYIYMY